MLAFFLVQLETEDDKEFFEHLYNKYFFKVIQNVLPILKSQDLAEQVAIDTFWLLSQKFAEISRRDEDKIKGWLYVVAKNKAWHVLEKKYAKKRVPEECVEFPDDFAAPATDEQVADLREAVAKLPEKYQCVVQLHYFEGYLAWEVAQILGLKTNTVEQQLSRARKMLKDMLVDE